MRCGLSPGSNLTQTNSVEPPPMSNSSARRPAPRQQRRATLQRQRRFLPRGDHVEVQTGLAGHPCHELTRIRRTATRLGRDRTQARHPAPRDPVRTGLQRHHRPVHGRRAQPAGFVQPFPQPHHPAETFQHPEPLRRRCANQQPAVVRTQIQRRKGWRLATVVRPGRVKLCHNSTLHPLTARGKRFRSHRHIAPHQTGCYQPRRRRWGIV